MIVESFDIRRFGRLTDAKFAFDRGFNLIEGPAESGKTTLAAFLVYMLYGFPTAKAGAALDERTLRTPWDGAEVSGSMVFSVSGVRYRVTRSSAFTDRGWQDTFALENLDTGEDERSGTDLGARFLGVSCLAFLDTAMLSDVRRGAPDADEMHTAIENILFSGDESLSAARAAIALSEAAHEIDAEGTISGAVAVLEKEKALLEAELAEETCLEREHYRLEEELFLTRRKMTEAREKVEELLQNETNYYNAMMIEDYDRLHALEDAAEGRVDAIRAHERAYRAADFLPDREYLYALSTHRTEAQSAEREVNEAQEALDALPAGKEVVSTDESLLIACVERDGGEEALLGREKSDLQNKHRKLTLGGVLAFLTLLFSVLFFVSGFRSVLAVVFGGAAILCLGAAALLFVEGVRAHRRLTDVYESFSAIDRDDFLSAVKRAAEAKLRATHADAERERAQVRLSRAKERFVLAQKALEAHLARWGCSLDVAEDLGAQVDEVIARGEDFLYEDERLHAEHKAATEEVLALRAKLQGQNEVAVRALVAPDKRSLYRDQDADALRHDVELYRDRLGTLSEDEKNLLARLAAATMPDEPPAAIAERILALDARIAALRETAASLRLACEAVKGGEGRLRAEITPRLSLDACRHLYEMTDGKYSELSVSGDMGLSFDEGDGARAVAYLSHSTEDLTYFALRFALLSLIYRESPPICLDGCTARQDDERALSFLRAVRTMTEEGRQCFFFASHARERAMVEQVFSTYGHVVMSV